MRYTITGRNIDVTPGLRAAIEEKIETVRAELKEKAMEARLEAEAIDVTIPGKTVSIGHQHPMNQVLQTIKDIFVGLGYQVLTAPRLNLPTITSPS